MPHCKPTPPPGRLCGEFAMPVYSDYRERLHAATMNEDR